ncbi:MAG: biotin/lipoyl-containing protein [Desulfurococcaceae archaeon]
MPRVFKVRTTLGATVELELIEKTRDLIVFKDRRTGKLYKLRVERANDGKYIMNINGELYSVFSSELHGVYVNSEPLLVDSISYIDVVESKELKAEKPAGPRTAEPGLILSPITGKILEVKVKPGDKVSRGDVVLLMESMKMVIEVKSDLDGVVEEVYVSPGSAVKKGEKLVKIKQL